MFESRKNRRDLSRRLDQLSARLARQLAIDSERYREEKLREPRYQKDLRLLKFGWRAYSQNDEDGIIEEIFHRIGVTNRRFVEFGVDNGLESNTLNLLVGGWSGLWLESESAAAASIAERFASFTKPGKLRIDQARVSPANINDLLGRLVPAEEPDLLSIDIDGNDYWVWRELEVCRPRVVVVEYNGLWRPPLAVTIAYNEHHVWRHNNYFGASLSALEKLGASKGYNLVGCCFAGVNAFFVRQELCGERFLAPYTAENHYEPPRPFMSGNEAAHPPGIGPLETV